MTNESRITQQKQSRRQVDSHQPFALSAFHIHNESTLIFLFGHIMG